MRFFVPVLLAVALSACTVPADPSQISGSPDPAASSSPSPIASVLPQSASGIVDMAHYTQIQNGMTLVQVDALMGSSGKNVSSSGSGTSEIDSYQWTGGSSFQFVIVTFMGGSVEGKTQVGL